MTLPTRTCRTCGLAKADKEFPHVQGGGEKRLSAECLACLNAKDEAKRFKPIPACPVCKRPATAPHDTWCEHGVGEVYTIPPLDLATMAMDRKLAEAKAEAEQTKANTNKHEPREEAPMPSATISEALNGLGIMASRDNIPDHEADRRIAAKATKPAPTRDTMCPCGQAEKEQRKAKNGATTTTGRCVECRKFYQSKRRQALASEAAGKAQAASLAKAVETLSEPEPDLVVINEPGANCPQIVDRSDLAALRAERDRCAAYLVDLDKRIDEAEALQAFGGLSAEELQAQLDAAERTKRLAQLALASRKAG